MATAAQGAWDEAVAAVNAAYALHDSYSPEDQQQLREHAARARAALQGIEPLTARDRARHMYLRGKVLDASQEYSPEAETLLTAAVKLDPTIVDAWNTLGECVWKGGRLELARACYLEALRLEANAESLCQLSMLLRTMSNSSDAALVSESLRLAKEAVALDVSSGRSWYVLGNAYLSSYFVATHRLEDLAWALKAYRRAARAPHRCQAACADLHYNQAIVLQYRLEYCESARAFAEAQRLGPELNAAAQRRALLAFARKCAEAVQMRGHLPKKRLQQLERGLRGDPDPAALQGTEPVALADLRPGPNPGVSVTCAVVGELVPESRTPLCYVLVDRAGDAILGCVYKTVPSAVAVYQRVTVLHPMRAAVEVPADDAGGGADVAYGCLVVEDPIAHLLVQGRALDRSQLSAARVTNAATVPASASARGHKGSTGGAHRQR